MYPDTCKYTYADYCFEYTCLYICLGLCVSSSPNPLSVYYPSPLTSISRTLFFSVSLSLPLCLLGQPPHCPSRTASASLSLLLLPSRSLVIALSLPLFRLALVFKFRVVILVLSLPVSLSLFLSVSLRLSPPPYVSVSAARVFSDCALALQYSAHRCYNACVPEFRCPWCRAATSYQSLSPPLPSEPH